MIFFFINLIISCIAGFIFHSLAIGIVVFIVLYIIKVLGTFFFDGDFGDFDGFGGGDFGGGGAD